MQEDTLDNLIVKDKLIACNGIIYIEKNDSNHIEITSQQELEALLNTIDRYNIQLRIANDKGTDIAFINRWLSNDDHRDLFKIFLPMFLKYISRIVIYIWGYENIIPELFNILANALIKNECIAEKFICIFQTKTAFSESIIPIIDNFNLNCLKELTINTILPIANLIHKNSKLSTLDLSFCYNINDSSQINLTNTINAISELPQLKSISLFSFFKPTYKFFADNLQKIKRLPTLAITFPVPMPEVIVSFAQNLIGHPTILGLKWSNSQEKLLSETYCIVANPHLSIQYQFPNEKNLQISSTILLDLVTTFRRNFHFKNTNSNKSDFKVDSLKFLCAKAVFKYHRNAFFANSSPLPKEAQDPLNDKRANLDLVATYIGNYLYFYNVSLAQTNTQNAEKTKITTLYDYIDYAKSELIKLEQSKDSLLIIEENKNSIRCIVNFNKEEQIITIKTFHRENNVEKTKIFDYNELKMMHMEKEFADTRNQQKPVNPKKRTREEDDDDNYERREPSPFNIGQVQ